ncbi:Zn-ribbon domain-containing OB-fold protein [Streptomyces sp. bgisy100]|uniref:Zn-ribbon domain-containing OB-fold protein n=1 Tax=Streptomyces sp. bgisy100 TaxID=3413783 RepID=UPI003D711715
MVDAARFDLPETDAFTRAYWDAAAEGMLLIRRCAACGVAHHYPREFCPRCWSGEVSWERASGRAALYTWSVVHRNDLPPFGERLPYVAAVVDLAEGPRMMTEIVDCDPDRLAVGQDLEVAFRDVVRGSESRRPESQGGADQEVERIAVPVFRPACSGSSVG